MQFSKSFTNVTPFSKFLALFLFVLFPLTGFYLGMEYQKMVSLEQQTANPPTKVISPTTSPAQPDDMSNWKTYRNKEYEFEFQYPNNWFFQGPPNWSDKKTVHFFAVGTTPEYALGGYSGNELLTLYVVLNEQSLEKYREELLQSGYEGKFSSIQIDNKPAIKATPGIITGSESDYYVTTNSNNLLHLSIGAIDQKSLDQILSTFRFLDNNPTSITPIQQGHQCSVYYDVNDNPITACTTCGDNVCEKYESCTPTKKLTTDCGRLFCPGDCEK